MKIYFVRHGESVNNITGRYTGWMDIDLTDKGREDALRARALLKDLSFDRVYASDLKRARETAEIALPGVSYEVTPLIREIDVGDVAGTRFADAATVPPPHIAIAPKRTRDRAMKAKNFTVEARTE